MKKLFLVSLVTFGFCAIASAQTAEEFAAKKAAQKAGANTPPVMTVANTAKPVASATITSAAAPTNDVDAAGVVVPNNVAPAVKKNDAPTDANLTDAQKKAAAQQNAAPAAPAKKWRNN